MFKKLLLTVIAYCVACFVVPAYAQECCEEDYEFLEDKAPAVETNGKIDVSLLYLHVDVLNFGHTSHTIDMPGLKADLYYRIWKGWVVKPNIIYGRGDNKDRALTGGISTGVAYPATENLTLTALAGGNWGYLKSKFMSNLELPVPKFLVNERFRSCSFLLSLEASYTFCPGMRIILQYQYSWSKTHTKLNTPGGPIISRNSSRGPSWGAMFEYDLNQQWSVNFGAAYNTAFTREKHGLRITGVKLGVAYWF